MLEVIFIVLIVVVMLIVFVKYSSTDTKKIIFIDEQVLGVEKEKLLIAEKKFLQGKIKKIVFDDLKDDLERTIVEKELEIFRLKKERTISIEEKANAIYQKLVRPTKHRKVKLKHMLKQTELLRKEMSFLEAKLLKREISENLFKQLMREKEKLMLARETEIVDFVKAN